MGKYGLDPPATEKLQDEAQHYQKTTQANIANMTGDGLKKNIYK